MLITKTLISRNLCSKSLLRENGIPTIDVSRLFLPYSTWSNRAGASLINLHSHLPALAVMSNLQQPDLAFTKALPKVELHAHLTGSISRKCLHNIWLQKKSTDPSFALEDPLTAIPSATDGSIDVIRYMLPSLSSVCTESKEWRIQFLPTLRSIHLRFGL
jgi:hypothetical protein